MFTVKSCEEKMISTRDGETHIFLYRPLKEQPLLPIFVNIHGGGFVKGHREQDIVFSKNICSHMNCIVIDIDYATAPEKKYPYALHQCYDIVKWAWQNSDDLGIDRSKIVIGGHSAGGNLTVAIAIMAKQTKEFQIRMQIIDYPSLDLYTPPEQKRNAHKNPSLNPEKVKLYNDLYIENDQRLEPTASPYFAPDDMLEGLPEALILTAGEDLLGEEAEKYAFRLLTAGVPVTARRFLKSNHGFIVRRKDEFKEAEQMIFDALGRAFGN
jgi:acetyl esterase